SPRPSDARGLVAAIAPEGRPAVVEAEVRRRVAAVLDAAPGDLPADAPPVTLRLESVRSLSLRPTLQSDFRITPPATDVLGAAVASAVEDPGRGGWPDLADAPGPRFEPFPLTELQHAYLVGRASSFDLGGSSIHLYAEHHATTLDADRLRTALDLLVARHEML